MNKIIKNTLILTVITLISGLALGIVYQITLEPIAAAQDAAKQEAYREVLPDADSFEAYEEFDAKEAAKAVQDAGLTDETIDEVAVALDASGETAGYVVTSTTAAGYGGEIQISVGIDAEGTVKGISILSISETAGLGMKADEAEFRDQFKDKAVSQFGYTKSAPSSDGEIQAISGATITTSAVVNDVNAALAYYQAVLGGGNTNE